MMRGWPAPALWLIGVAVVGLVSVASVRAAQAPAAADAPLTTEKHFKNIVVLKGMPVDTFFDAMGMFAASMGDDCTYCHVKEAVFNHAAFATPTPRIQKARQMILMMQALNKLKGQPVIASKAPLERKAEAKTE